MANVDPNTTHTLNEFISTGIQSSAVTYYSTSIVDGGNNGIFYSINNVVFDYLDELKELREVVELNAEQKQYYKYDGVYLLAYDVYGNRDLAYLIMALNGVYNPKDFTMNPIYLIRKSTMASALESIYNAQKEYIDFNRSQMKLSR